MSLKEKALIVELVTSHWTAKKYDAKVSKEIDESHDAVDSGRFNKTLITSELLDDIKSCVSKARTYHYKVTIPWDDAGQRILPVAEYMNYTAKIEEFITEHKRLVDIFIDHYPKLRKKAEKRLNTLFNEIDYPDVSSLKGKFAIAYQLTPISDASDLRVDASKSEVKEIRKNIEAGLIAKMNTAKQSIVDKALKVVEAAYDKLSDKKATFRDTITGNVKAVIEAIPVLNFDNDEQLIKLRKKLKKLDVPAASLRRDKKVRKDTAKKAKKLLKYVKSITFE